MYLTSQRGLPTAEQIYSYPGRRQNQMVMVESRVGNI